MVTKSPICTLLLCRVATCAGHAAGPSHIYAMARRVTQRCSTTGGRGSPLPRTAVASRTTWKQASPINHGSVHSMACTKPLTLFLKRDHCADQHAETSGAPCRFFAPAHARSIGLLLALGCH